MVLKAKPTRPSSLPASRSASQPSIRFGALCPICLTLLAGGIGAGIAFLRSKSGKKDNKYGLENLYGKELAAELMQKLEALEKKSPGVIKQFVQNPEKGSQEVMQALGEDLSKRLQAALDKKKAHK
jgi:hypothetical protein